MIKWFQQKKEEEKKDEKVERNETKEGERTNVAKVMSHIKSLGHKFGKLKAIQDHFQGGQKLGRKKSSEIPKTQQVAASDVQVTKMKNFQTLRLSVFKTIGHRVLETLHYAALPM